MKSWVAAEFYSRSLIAQVHMILDLDLVQVVTYRAYGAYALCVTLFNVFRRLKLGAYCVVIRGIPAHSEGILGEP